jgi:hypothetical protein
MKLCIDEEFILNIKYKLFDIVDKSSATIVELRNYNYTPDDWYSICTPEVCDSSTFNELEVSFMYSNITNGYYYLWQDIYRDFLSDNKRINKIVYARNKKKSLNIDLQYKYLDYWIKRMLFNDTREFGEILVVNTIKNIKILLYNRLLTPCKLIHLDFENTDYLLDNSNSLNFIIK